MRSSLPGARAMLTVLLSMGLLTVAAHAQSFYGSSQMAGPSTQSLPDDTVNPADQDTIMTPMELEASEIEPLPRIITPMASEIEPLPRIITVTAHATITPAEAEEIIRAFEPDVTVEH